MELFTLLAEMVLGEIALGEIALGETALGEIAVRRSVATPPPMSTVCTFKMF